MGKPTNIKTKQNESSVEDFLNSLKDNQQRLDSFRIIEMMKKASGEEPKMWGASLIGFGTKRYKSPKTSREVDWFHIGFSPRKTNLSIHLVLDMNKYASKLEKLGKHKTGVGCLYINKLEDIDLVVLQELIQEGLKEK